MKKSHLLGAVGAFIFLSFFSLGTSAATLNVSGGILLGAFDVDVGGTLYDVEFVDGTCIALFDGCDDLSDFTFTTSADAKVAALALLDQVFIGTFDTAPELTFGCGFPAWCGILTPYTLFSIFGQDRVDNYEATNHSTTGDSISNINQSNPISLDTTDRKLNVYASWTIAASTIPIPGAVWLFGSGLIGLVGLARRKKA